MKTNLKLNTLLFAMVAFLAVSCGQSKESSESPEATENHEKGHDHQDGDHHEHATDNDEVATAGISVSDEQASGILNAYLEMKDALVKSSAEVAKNAAEEIKNILNDNADSKLLSGILTDADNIIEADEVEQIREHFDDMSKNVYELVKANNPDMTVYKQYCPMAFDNQGAFWLSSEEEIRNPYFGDKMLKCGKVQETVASK
ncbi:MAG: DUF3347 domain-containing protein [Fulvivirga sp.]